MRLVGSFGLPAEKHYPERRCFGSSVAVGFGWRDLHLASHPPMNRVARSPWRVNVRRSWWAAEILVHERGG